ncbi:TatD family hydrolase [Flaviflexus massiliensis]|uniref:TatD family hydrolase n=1 Tax=Flaviflexus massiliensis TaxID=1522309 RepID=UPI0006D58259|nr:TatD family hydrolase [Flaviflexus massiliensis]
MSKKDRSVFPPLPDPLPVSVIDNHTHVGTDREGQEQKVNDQGKKKYPLLIEGQREAMAHSGIKHAITVGCEVPDLKDVIELASTVKEFSAAIAIHPNEAALHAGVREIAPDGLEPNVLDHHRDYDLDAAVALVAELATSEHVVAIGETGLDYFRTGDEGKGAQQESFRAHIALAKELSLPLQIHDRDAHEDTVRILLEEGAPERTVFHCFSGDRELAGILNENGWYASFAGTVTFPKNEYLREALMEMREELILVETDAPYLTPHPHRGKPNAPYLANLTVRAMATNKGVALDTFCERLLSNANGVYFP